jgi:hypothetical protein
LEGWRVGGLEGWRGCLWGERRVREAIAVAADGSGPRGGGQGRVRKTKKKKEEGSCGAEEGKMIRGRIGNRLTAAA